MKCSETIIAKWAHSEVCSLQIMCPKLGELVCGSYGLLINNMDICSEKKLYVTKMETQINFEFWSTKSSKPDIECFIWCDTKVDFKAKQSLLVSSTFLDSQMNLASINYLHMSQKEDYYITSPYRVYSIVKNQICHQGMVPCESRVHFIWKRDTICQARFVCSSLSENVCGDSLLQMSSIGQSMSLLNKFSHQIYLSDLLILFMAKDFNSTFFVVELFLNIKTAGKSDQRKVSVNLTNKFDG